MSENTQETAAESLAAAPSQDAPDGQLDDSVVESVAGGHIGEDTSLGHDVGTILAMPIVAGYKLAQWIDSKI